MNEPEIPNLTEQVAAPPQDGDDPQILINQTKALLDQAEQKLQTAQTQRRAACDDIARTIEEALNGELKSFLTRYGAAFRKLDHILFVEDAALFKSAKESEPALIPEKALKSIRQRFPSELWRDHFMAAEGMDKHISLGLNMRIDYPHGPFAGLIDLVEKAVAKTGKITFNPDNSLNILEERQPKLQLFTTNATGGEKRGEPSAQLPDADRFIDGHHQLLKDLFDQNVDVGPTAARIKTLESLQPRIKEGLKELERALDANRYAHEHLCTNESFSQAQEEVDQAQQTVQEQSERLAKLKLQQNDPGACRRGFTTQIKSRGADHVQRDPDARNTPAQTAKF